MIEDDSQYYEPEELLITDNLDNLWAYEFTLTPYINISMASYSKDSEVDISINVHKESHVCRVGNMCTIWTNKPYSLKYMRMVELTRIWG